MDRRRQLDWRLVVGMIGLLAFLTYLDWRFAASALALGAVVYYFMFLRTRPPVSDESLDGIASLDSKPSFGGGATILEINQALHGTDVRTLWQDGFSDKQIKNLLAGEYNVLELYEKQPLGNNKSDQGKAILAKLKPAKE